MTKWVYTLVAGKELRANLYEDNSKEALDSLSKCWREIHEKFSNIFNENELSRVISEIDNQKDNLDNYIDYDMTLEDVEDEINNLLEDLYEFCDTHKIWLQMI